MKTKPVSKVWTGLHITRVDGEIVSAAKEMRITGEITIHVNGELLGVANEVKTELPLPIPNGVRLSRIFR